MDALEELIRDTISRRRVQDDGQSQLACQGNRLSHHRKRDLELHHQVASFPQEVSGRTHVVHGYSAICPGSHDDRVLAVGVDDDHCRSAGSLGVAQDVRGAHTLSAQVVQKNGAKTVSAHPADHLDIDTQPGRRGGLIGPLAAGNHRETLTMHGLTRAGHVRGPDYQVHVQAAQHDDITHRLLPSWALSRRDCSWAIWARQRLTAGRMTARGARAIQVVRSYPGVHETRERRGKRPREPRRGKLRGQW